MLPIITLTTDFGSQDSYVGVMKGVMLGICPQVHLVDITHVVPPQDIAAAMRVVQQTTPYFPPQTVHLVVVDPGVGSARRPVALATPQGRYVGPDNGLFGEVWQQARQQGPQEAEAVRAVALTEERYWRHPVSATFHGRDIFAPVAAHLAAGVALEAFGPPLADLVQLAPNEPAWETPACLRGEIVTVDHFGNAISNISIAHLEQLGATGEAAALYVLVGDEAQAPIATLPVYRTYADVSPGEGLALVGSGGYLEVAVRNGSAVQRLGIGAGTGVRVRRG